jgi:hypothetical protein
MKEPASDSSAQPIASCGKNDEAGAIVSLPSASGSGREKASGAPAGCRNGPDAKNREWQKREFRAKRTAEETD